MSIQYISLKRKSYKNFVCSTFDDVKTIDSFNSIVVDLTDKDIWTCDTTNDLANKGYLCIKCEKDLTALGNLIANSKRKGAVFLLPNNFDISYYYNTLSRKMSEVLNDFCLRTIKHYFRICNLCTFGFENNTCTLKNGKERTASFYFAISDQHYDVITSSTDSEKPLIIKEKNLNIYYSFLSIDKEDDVIAVLEETSMLTSDNEIPQWLTDINIFDDVSLKTDIKEKERQIVAIQDSILKDKDKLSKNLFYKKILLVNDKELVEIVFNILEEILSIDLSGFVDKKEADFVFGYNNSLFIGEIKGINTNVKNANIAQVSNHEAIYLDEHEDESRNITKLLIINHQRLSPLEERQPVNTKQIEKAKRDGVLIIETTTLLKILELFRQKEISSNDIYVLVSNNVGLLVLEMPNNRENK